MSDTEAILWMAGAVVFAVVSGQVLTRFILPRLFPPKPHNPAE